MFALNADFFVWVLEREFAGAGHVGVEEHGVGLEALHGVVEGGAILNAQGFEHACARPECGAVGGGFLAMKLEGVDSAG